MICQRTIRGILEYLEYIGPIFTVVQNSATSSADGNNLVKHRLVLASIGLFLNYTGIKRSFCGLPRLVCVSTLSSEIKKRDVNFIVIQQLILQAYSPKILTWT